MFWEGDYFFETQDKIDLPIELKLVWFGPRVHHSVPDDQVAGVSDIGGLHDVVIESHQTHGCRPHDDVFLGALPCLDEGGHWRLVVAHVALEELRRIMHKQPRHAR